VPGTNRMALLQWTLDNVHILKLEEDSERNHILKLEEDSDTDLFLNILVIFRTFCTKGLLRLFHVLFCFVCYTNCHTTNPSESQGTQRIFLSFLVSNTQLNQWTKQVVQQALQRRGWRGGLRRWGCTIGYVLQTIPYLHV